MGLGWRTAEAYRRPGKGQPSGATLHGECHAQPRNVALAGFGDMVGSHIVALSECHTTENASMALRPRLAASEFIIHDGIWRASGGVSACLESAARTLCSWCVGAMDAPGCL